jgi:putative DNA methylase
MTTYRKKLIEVALPLAAINAASGAEKLIHVGTTSNVHAWWAPRPLAACRAIIFASLVDDPGEHMAPPEADRERQRLFDLIQRLVQWDANNDPRLLAEIRHEIAANTGGRRVTVVDPFSGRGTIPVEALRLGLDAVGFDLNPVAVSISKALVEVPRVVSGHASIMRAVGQVDSSGDGFENFKHDLKELAGRILKDVSSRVRARYADSYSGTKMPFAWLWCRTADCPNPACGSRIPLTSSMWLSKAPEARAWLEFRQRDSEGRIGVSIKTGTGEPPAPSVTDSGAVCPACRAPITFAALREQGRSGGMGFQLNAFVTKTGHDMRFHVATAAQERAALAIRPNWAPETSLPEAALGFRVQKYGLTTHRALFLDRQLAMLDDFSDALTRTIDAITKQCGGDVEYARALALYLALFFDRLVQTNNALVRWLTRATGPSKAQPTFDKQTVQMVWDL